MTRRSRAWTPLAASLLAAALSGCPLRSPFSQDELDAGGYTALMHAAEDGDVERIESLLRRGADIDYQGRLIVRYSLLFPFRDESWEDVPLDSLTPLMVAARD